jgi:hypothetical protein
VLATLLPPPLARKHTQGFNGPFPTVGGFAGTELTSTVSLLYQNDWCGTVTAQPSVHAPAQLSP